MESGLTKLQDRDVKVEISYELNVRGIANEFFKWVKDNNVDLFEGENFMEDLDEETKALMFLDHNFVRWIWIK